MLLAKSPSPLAAALVELVAFVMVCATVLVMPTYGLSRPGEHLYALVHPVFPHYHGPGLEHGTNQPVGETIAASVAATRVSPAAPPGVRLGLGIDQVVLLAGALLTLHGIWAAAKSRNPALVQQVWLRVPTGPPR